MSIESAKAFIEKVNKDQDFKKKLSEFKDGTERMKYAKEKGFDFTPAEIAKLKEEQGLTDAELDAVAGGVCGKLCIAGVGDCNIE